MVRRGVLTGLGCAALAAALAVPAVAYAQAAGRGARAQGQAEGPGQRGGGARTGRAGLPPLGRNPNAQQLQEHIDALALVQAQEALKLTDEQQAPFAAKMVRLQNVRKRVMAERRKILMTLRGLLDAQGKDEAINEQIKSWNDANRRAADDIAKAVDELDAVLTPWQRGQFRLFEERLERQKVELLARISGR